MTHTNQCETARGPECVCACKGLLHSAEKPFKFTWDGGATWLSQETPAESFAAATFADGVRNKRLREWSIEVGERLRLLLEETGHSATDDLVGEVLRLAVEDRRRKGEPRANAAEARNFELPKASADGDESEHHDDDNAAEFARALSSGDDVHELALILAMPDLTCRGLGNSKIAAEQVLVLNVLLSGCWKRGEPQNRPKRRGPRADGVRAQRQVRERARAAIKTLPELERCELEATLLADSHFLCAIAALAAKAFDLPTAAIEGTSAWLVKQVVESFFEANSDSDASHLAVYAGGLVVSELLGTVVHAALGTAAFHPAAQLSRVFAFALCPDPATHPLVADATRQCFRAEFEEAAVIKLFGWLDALAIAT
jgi:hypothetical protein